MNLDDLSKPAEKAARVSRRILRWSISDDPASAAKYLFARNRFAVMFRIWMHLTFLVEIYLIYSLFHARMAASIGVLIVVTYIVRAFQRGVAQMARVRIVEMAASKAPDSRVSEVYTWLLNVSTLIGVGGGALTIALAYLPIMSDVARVFAFAAAFVLPVQLSASAALTVHYVWRRLRRNAWFTFLPYLLPSLMLLLTYRQLGPYGYVLGYFLARLIFNGYTLRLCTDGLRRCDIVYQRASWRLARIARREFSENTLRAHIFIPLATEAYVAGISVLVYLRGPELWLTHFAFSTILLLMSFPVARVPTSLSIDLYFALRRANSALASMHLHRIRRLFSLLLAVISGAALVAYVAVSVKFGMIAGVAYTLAPYLLALFLSRSLFHSRLQLLSASGSDRHVARVLATSFSLMLIYQSVTILKFRANLQAVYLFEAAMFSVLWLYLRRVDVVHASPISAAVKDEQPESVYQPPTLLRGNNEQKALSKDRPLLGAFVLLHEFLQPESRHEAFGRLIRDELGDDSEVFVLCPRFLFVRERVGVRQSPLEEQLLLRFPGHIRGVFPFEKEADILNHAATIRRYFNRRTMIPEPMRPMLTGIESGTFSRIADDVASQSGVLAMRDGQLRFAQKWLALAGAGDVSRYEVHNRSRYVRGWITDDFVQFVARRGLSAKEILPRHKPPFALVAVLGEMLVVADIRDLQPEKRAEVYRTATCLSAVLSLLSTVGSGQSVASLPEPPEPLQLSSAEEERV